MSTVATNPATLFGRGTWVAFGAGRVLVGNDGATFATDETTGGALTHSHAFTQPSDHPSLAHTGAAVANHTVTQPGSATTGLSLSAHTGAAVGDHASHTHTSASTTTTPKLVTSNTSTGVSVVTGGPSATLTHSMTQPGAHTVTDPGHSHSGAAVDAHSVTQPASHAAQSHTGGAVTDGATMPPYVVVHFWKRTT